MSRKKIYHYKSLYLATAFTILAIIAVLGSYNFYLDQKNARSVSAIPSVTSEVANLQGADRSVSGRGQVKPKVQLSLGFKNSGRLAVMQVAVGDKVKPGQVLATLDQSDALASMAQARANLNSAKAAYDKMLNGPSAAEIAVNQAVVASAKVTLANARSNYDQAVKQQQAAISEAFTNLMNSSIIPIAGSGNSSKSTFVISGIYTDTTQGSYKIMIGGSPGYLTYAVSGLEAAADTLIAPSTQQALGSRGLSITFTGSNYTIGDYWTIAIPNTQTSIYVHNYNLYQDALQTQTKTLVAAQGQIQAAQAALDQANAQLNLKLTPARPEDIAAAQARLDSAKAQLEAAQNNYNNTLLKTPSSGTITVINKKIGEQIPPGSEVLRLVDPDSLYIQTNIPENLIGRISIGQKVDIIFDAFGSGSHFNGNVTSIAPTAVTSGADTLFPVLISFTQNDGVKAGMSAHLKISPAPQP